MVLSAFLAHVAGAGAGQPRGTGGSRGQGMLARRGNAARTGEPVDGKRYILIMSPHFIPRILGLTAVLALAAQTAAGARVPITPRTTAPDVYITINVKMTNTRFILSQDTGPRGADARFVLKNVSNRPHTFALGNGKFKSGAQTGFSAKVAPGKQKILILFLDIRGSVQYYPGLPADRKNAGMKGTFRIGPCTHYEMVTGVAEC